MKRLFKFLGKILLWFFILSIGGVVVFKFVPVFVTPLMIIRVFEQIADGKEIQLKHDWVPLEEISRHLPQAVVASEDNLFMEHSGFDFKQIQLARKDAAKGKRVRGASTISQQTAKNVFLWQGKSYFRKGLEAYFTLLIETIWGKKRIMEVYLNSIEMGDGIYGAERVAQLHFNKSAAKLSKAQAATIAATLPNPIRFNSAKPSSYIKKRKNQIMSLMGKIATVEFE
jgi:monofunctional biosynthetic peptidoglycan transglycosylase